MKIKYLIFAVVIVLSACSPMDDKHRHFVENGPIVYLTKMNSDDVAVVGEREKVVITLPAMTDQRPTGVTVTWANRTRSLERSINPATKTVIEIKDLNEGSYIFEFTLTDDDGNRSLITQVAASVYGDVYEALLVNRAILSDVPVQGKREFTFARVYDNSMVATVFEWTESGVQKSFVADTALTRFILDDFNASSLKYYTIYKPSNTDYFLSQPSYVFYNPNVEDVAYTGAGKRFVFPDLSVDDHWTGYELRWVDRFTLEPRSFTAANRNTTFQIPDYEAAEFSYAALFNYDERMLSATANLKLTSTRNFLDRSSWRVAPETETGTGRDLQNVTDGTWEGAVEAIDAKQKSPFLSQRLPWATSTPEAQNSPRAHIDGNNATCLIMVKGPGYTFGTNDQRVHTFGGVSSADSDFGDEIYFIIDLGREEEFDHFRIHYRLTSSGSVASLKPQGVMLFGSNDPDCINDQSKWTAITDRIIPPYSSLANIGTDPNGIQNSTGNVQMRFSRYRYVKCRYTDWIPSVVNAITGANDGLLTIQISEFNLGQTVYQ
jgi:hypothetical protein